MSSSHVHWWPFSKSRVSSFPFRRKHISSHWPLWPPVSPIHHGRNSSHLRGASSSSAETSSSSPKVPAASVFASTAESWIKRRPHRYARSIVARSSSLECMRRWRRWASRAVIHHWSEKPQWRWMDLTSACLSQLPLLFSNRKALLVLGMLSTW